MPLLLLVLVALDSEGSGARTCSPASPQAFHLSVLAPSADDLKILLRPLS